MAPTQDQLREMFSLLSVQGSQKDFMQHVADNVNWTILGHSPLSRTYKNKQEFIDATLTFLADKIMTEPLRLRIVHISGGGVGEDCATIEMTAIDAECKNGLKYDMSYCWVCQFDQNNKIVQVRAYLDTQLLTDAIEQNQ